jgi:hypothetical protein
MTFRLAISVLPATVTVLTYLLDNRQNPGLRIIIAIGTDTEVDLVLERVRFVCSDKAEQRVWRGEGNGGECGGHCVVVGVEVVLDRGQTLGRSRRSICRNRRLLVRRTHLLPRGRGGGFVIFSSVYFFAFLRRVGARLASGNAFRVLSAC